MFEHPCFYNESMGDVQPFQRGSVVNTSSPNI